MKRYFHMRRNLFAFVVVSVGFFSNSFASPIDPPTANPFVVVLDAGHGGKDPGNRGNGYYEKNIALNIVLEIGSELEKIPNVKVIYTRKSDVFIPLATRADIANDAKADLFVSIHCNSHSSQARGTETFVLGLHRNKDNLEIAMRENSVIFLEEDYEVTYDGFNPNSPESYIGLTLMQEEYLDQSILLADLIQKDFTNGLKRTNRGVKQAGFLVLRETYMPSVLVETGFLTNKEEGSFLNSRNGQRRISNSIVDAVNSYRKDINLNVLEILADSEEQASQILEAEVSNKKETIYEGITFKVQLAASGKKLETKPYNFKGLDKVTRTKEGKMYKYYYGATSNYAEIKRMKARVQENGFPAGFIVAFRDGKKIEVKDALKTKVD